VDVALVTYGPSRLLAGSDWPVCLLAGSYREVLDATRTVLFELSRDELAAVFGRTAIEVYGLAVDGR
jgi:L-fuconolactonase